MLSEFRSVISPLSAARVDQPASTGIPPPPTEMILHPNMETMLLLQPQICTLLLCPTHWAPLVSRIAILIQFNCIELNRNKYTKDPDKPLDRLEFVGN